MPATAAAPVPQNAGGTAVPVPAAAPLGGGGGAAVAAAAGVDGARGLQEATRGLRETMEGQRGLQRAILDGLKEAPKEVTHLVRAAAATHPSNWLCK